MMYTILATGLLVATLASAQVGVSGAQTPQSSDYTPEQIADGTAFNNVSRMALENMQYNSAHRNTIGHSITTTNCTYEIAQQRQEWRTLDTATRKSFTSAATCLMKLPPTHMTAAEAPYYPGIKSRHDEYVATHINYTLNIHDTADFFAWHRMFIHFWEQDLKNLCGYTGVLPYWNWALDAAAPQDSPLFTGDAYSMGSNGKYIANRTDTWLALQVSLATLTPSPRYRTANTASTGRHLPSRHRRRLRTQRPLLQHDHPPRPPRPPQHPQRQQHLPIQPPLPRPRPKPLLHPNLQHLHEPHHDPTGQHLHLQLPVRLPRLRRGEQRQQIRRPRRRALGHGRLDVGLPLFARGPAVLPASRDD